MPDAIRGEGRFSPLIVFFFFPVRAFTPYVPVINI